MRRKPCRARAAALIVALTCVQCGDSASFDDRIYPIGGGDAAIEPAHDAGRDQEPAPGDAGVDEMPPPDKLPCTPVVSSDALHPRDSVMRAASEQSAPTFFTRDLFNLFRSHCGGCHVDNSLGGLQVTLLNFPQKITSKALDRIRSDDPGFFMPPTGMPFSKRKPDDPIVEFSALLEAWLAAGSPSGVFYPPGSASSSGHSYALSSDVAMQMTNIGSCVPDKAMVFSDAERSQQLDAMFEQASELPKRLEDTDLTTFDSEALAREGVIAFAPAYTLWADNAKKIRLVRVPRGEAIAFDKESQTFRIPASTRFYKTFLKRVIDEKGNETYRKMETRLIVSRPDETLPDGTVQSKALFGTYAWNESESEATLVEDPLRNGKPFRDRLLTYVINEKVAEQVLRTGPDDLDSALREAGATRTYAIPGGERCKHCHMGAVNASFVLGFTPLQINRRPMGEGGVIEPAARDELNQLQRFIDYGLIKGMASPKDVLELENAEGDRKPRNEQELIAQGYMVGNCAHCHNPRGFPSRIAPELRDVLDFYPGKDGGVFQFPLERYSPRIFRGPERDVPIPYITPSLYDRAMGDNQIKGVTYDHLKDKDGNYVDPTIEPILAPWRSLIYRNTDAPFSYADDTAIFPHMPFDTAGYDCRTRQIFGSWMTSIPARWKQEGIMTPGQEVQEDHEPQPYSEVLPDDPDYSRQVRVAKARMRSFQQDQRYNGCPNPELDVVDPGVALGSKLVPDAEHYLVKDTAGNELGHVAWAIPERAHWAVTDLTEPAGEWNPRRPDWKDVLIDGTPNKDHDKQLAVDLLTSANIHVTDNDELHHLALDDRPFGIWEVKDGCDFSSLKKLGELDQPPGWLGQIPAVDRPGPDAPVYWISPGAQVFTAICSNCHGPLADSTGRLAATIADMTGGQTRVANLRDGIFGPVDHPGSNRGRIFGVEGSPLAADDWASRYVLWMGLGGTQRTIPPAALSVVASTNVLGKPRGGLAGFTVTSANMLTAATFLCGEVLPNNNRKEFEPGIGAINHASTTDRSALIATNGDAEMWNQLCTFENPLPVRMAKADIDNDILKTFRIATVSGTDGNVFPLFVPSSYPSNALVGDQAGAVTTGIQPGNTAPWCIQQPEVPSHLQVIQEYWEQTLGRAGTPIPYCPDPSQLQRWSEDDVKRWQIRGGMNAGLSVFLYLDALAKGEKQRPIPFDHCESLQMQGH